jgi:7-cyano-7-deazaguanine synthase in queuosine biosynthesis
MNSHRFSSDSAVPFCVDVVEAGKRARQRRVKCEIGKNIQFSTVGLQSYFFADWSEIAVDLLLVAAAIEFCDRAKARPRLGWSRAFQLRIPVHDVSLWQDPRAVGALTSAINFLTGDLWAIDFVARTMPAERINEVALPLPADVSVIMPYSGGLDSRAVAALLAADHNYALVRVRLGASGPELKRHRKARQPFTDVPYTVSLGDLPMRESSARSRGFKFAAVTGVAAYLAKATEIVVSESGQGALGPVLVVSGQAYADYRSYPAFTVRMEELFKILLDRKLKYRFPRIWHTKGETLAQSAGLMGSTDPWWTGRSCWQGARQVSVNKTLRQCGICAACLLRRLSVHAAGLDEPANGYVWEDLRAPSFEDSAAVGFTRHTKALREYMIAGVRHLDDLASMAGSAISDPALRRISGELAVPLQLSREDVRDNLQSLLSRHRKEWLAFLDSLGPDSFVTKHASARQ